MSSDIHELNVEIAETEEQIKDKEKMKNDRERYLDYDKDPDFDFIIPPLEDCLHQASEAELLLIGAQEELKMAEKSKSITLPQFELVGKNKDAAIARTAQLKKEIDEAEELLEKSEADIKKLEKSLAHASNVYKAERERRAVFVDKLETELEELRKCVELSVVSMVPIDDDPSIPPGLETLRSISFLTSDREHQISTCEKLDREVAAERQRVIDELNQRNETQQRNLQDYKIAESNIDEVKNEIRANNAAYNKNLNANSERQSDNSIKSLDLGKDGQSTGAAQSQSSGGQGSSRRGLVLLKRILLVGFDLPFHCRQLLRGNQRGFHGRWRGVMIKEKQ